MQKARGAPHGPEATDDPQSHLDGAYHPLGEVVGEGGTRQSGTKRQMASRKSPQRQQQVGGRMLFDSASNAVLGDLGRLRSQPLGRRVAGRR